MSLRETRFAGRGGGGGGSSGAEAAGAATADMTPEQLEQFTILTDETRPTWPAKKPDRVIDFIMLDKAHAASYKKLGGGVEAFPDATDHCAIWVDVAAAPAP